MIERLKPLSPKEFRVLTIERKNVMSKPIMRLGWLVIISPVLITMFFSSSAAEAALPTLTTTELADLVQSYQGRIERVQFRYALVYGSLKDGDVSKGLFTPLSPAWIVNAESALDLGKGIEYIREEQISEGNKFIEECTFDGKLGMQLKTFKPGSNEWIGRIMERPPRKLRPEGRNRWRPEEVAYWPIPGYDLASLIRTAKKAKIESDEIDGWPCYKVTLRRVIETTAEYKGKQVPVKIDRLHRAWLAPDLNMLPLRFERLQPNKNTPDDMDGNIADIRRQFDFREVAPGIWFPFRCRYFRTWTNREPIAIEITMNKVSLNEDAVVSSRLSFPHSTYLTDEIKHLEYIVGLSNEHLMDNAALFADNIKAAQEGGIQSLDLQKAQNLGAGSEATRPGKAAPNELIQSNALRKANGIEDKPAGHKGTVLAFASAAGALVILLVLFLIVRAKRVSIKTK